ncbi:hypothetical protein [Chitinophaga sp.]|uniref:hypothetical protein n=1 Tax=Chitinophaga sp. TaxID=1869181 RepID=UPI002607A471|nr:hypothetical protein [uncultured Chitinophaga sp.]
MLIPMLWALACCNTPSARNQAPVISYIPIGDYRYLSPCGQSAFSDTLPAGRVTGEYVVYVLKDSSTVNNCLAAGHPGRSEGFPMRYGKDFLLIVEMKGTPGWGMDLRIGEMDGLLQLQLLPVKGGEVKDQYIWHFAAEGREVVRLTSGSGKFAYAKGPAWRGGRRWEDMIRLEGR